MSQKCQVNKILPFKVLPKWWISAILTSTYMEKRISCCPSLSVGLCLRLMHLRKWIGDMWEYLGVYKFQWVLGAQWCSEVCLRALFMRGPVWLETNQPIWHNIERRDCFLLTLSRHQNIKTSICIISKNGWVFPFFVILTPVTKKLQLTVLLDHPVYQINQIHQNQSNH